MSAGRTGTIALVTLIAACAAPVQAQQHNATPGSVTSWSPFLGCWSTSSAGAAGPMVCVVPTGAIDRVEFMSVSGDSVVSRTTVDASGARIRQRRGGCDGWESGRWSRDGERLFMHAEYRCPGARTQRSDAILSMTHADAFTRIERQTNRTDTPAQLVNFIVQLDTTVFPVEVRRRLPHYRPLALETAELERIEPVASTAVVEAAAELDEQVVSAWLEDRGQLDEANMLLRVMQLAERQQAVNQVWSPRARDLFNRAAWPTLFRVTQTLQFTAAWGRFGFIRGGEYPEGYVVTPAMVGFGLPYYGYNGGFTWSGWSH